MRTRLLSLVCCIAFTGCVSSKQRATYRAQVDFRDQVGPVAIVPTGLQCTVVINEEISFTVDTSPLDKNVRYTLATGRYTQFFQGPEGDFYKGGDYPVLRENSLGERRFEGGFFVPHDHARCIMIWSFPGDGVLGIATPSGQVLIESQAEKTKPCWVIAVPAGKDRAIQSATENAR